MKKLWMIILLVMALAPIKVGASDKVSVANIEVIGPEEIKVGEEFDYKFNFTFSGVGEEAEHNFVLVGFMYEMIYDSDAFLFTRYTTDAWDTGIEQGSNGEYLFLGVVGENTSSQCKNEIYCTTASTSFHFFVNETQKIKSNIKVKLIATIYFDTNDITEDMIDNLTEQQLEEISIVNFVNIEKGKDIKINQPESSTKPVTAPKVEIEEKKVELPKQAEIKNQMGISTTQTESTSGNQQTTPSPSTIKSDNNYLKSIKIEGYPIEFKKDQMKYEIIVEKNLNKLNVIVEQEDEKASVEIKGNDPLKEEIQITVKAENGNEQVYTIFVDSKEKEKIKEPKKKKNIKKELEKAMSDPRVLTIGGILGIILLIVIFVSTRNGRKIDKMLDKM